MVIRLLMASALLIGAVKGDAITYNWSTFPAAPSGGATGVTPDQRPAFEGDTSTLTNPTTYPSSIGSGGFDFVTFASPDFDNTSASAIPIQEDFGNTGDLIGLVFYANSFDPTNLSANYLADSGFFVTNGGDLLVGFMLPAHTQAIAVLFPDLDHLTAPSAISTLTAVPPPAVPEPANLGVAVTAIGGFAIWRLRRQQGNANRGSVPNGL